MAINSSKIAVVLPCYKVTEYILDVLSKISQDVDFIFAVDDFCPNSTGKFIEEHFFDARLVVLKNNQNLGVGGAVIEGYKAAINAGADIIIKIDGDGQMDPSLISNFITPILLGEADYTKGNRFYDLEKIKEMPAIRLFGNAILSFMTKLSSGYWNIFDPTNGYTAIHADVARRLPFDKISRRYFFETDMLFRLNTLRAVVADVPMDAKYSDEVSNLKISKIIGEFLVKHARNFFKRIFYNYYLRDMTIASIELPLGFILLFFGVFYGSFQWIDSAYNGIPTPAGSVMLSALPILSGLQFLLAFISYDVSSIPFRPIHRNKLNSKINN